MIEAGSQVSAACFFVTEDGTVLHGTPSGEPSPLDFTIGSGRIIPAIDGAARTMDPGERREFALSAKEVFGEYNPDLVVELPAGAVPRAEELPVGSYVVLDLGGFLRRCKIESVDDCRIVVDCNHEFAGQGARLFLDILSVQAPSADAVAAELHGGGCSCGCQRLKHQLTENSG